jgi:hypothetical protein
MKLYTEQQLKEAMKTIALHVYDKRESNDSNTNFTINLLINNLEPHHPVEANEMIKYSQIEKEINSLILETDFQRKLLDTPIKKYDAYCYNTGVIHGMETIKKMLNPKS